MELLRLLKGERAPLGVEKYFFIFCLPAICPLSPLLFPLFASLHRGFPTARVALSVCQ